jgi:hypothetical protein
MAKILLTAPVAALSGAVGNDYVGYGFGGRNFSRLYVVPQNNETPDVVAQRLSFATISQAYKALSVPEVDAWKAFGLLIQRRDSQGQLYSLTANQAFALVNNYRAMMGLAVIETPPAYVPPVLAVTAVNASVDAATGVLTVEMATPSGYAGGQKVIVEASRELGSATRNARDTDMRKVNTGVAGSMATLAAGTSTEFTAATPVFLYDTDPNWLGIRLTPVSAAGVPGVPLFRTNAPITFV